MANRLMRKRYLKDRLHWCITIFDCDDTGIEGCRGAIKLSYVDQSSSNPCTSV
jgi:hypothetical protein